jgi:cytochrome c peroxidase
MKVTQNSSDWAAFKTPSLRDITRSAPYFHDGSVSTLREAVVFMAKGGAKNRNLDVRLVDTKLSPAEINGLVAFLGSLECTGKLQRPADPPSHTH